MGVVIKNGGIVMQANLINALDEELESQQNWLKKIEGRMKMLEHLGNYVLIASMQRGLVRYYIRDKSNEGAQRKYLGEKQTSLRKNLQELYFLREAAPRCRKNIEMLELVIDSYNSVDPDEVVSGAPLAYREQQNANYLMYGYGSELRWKQRKLNYKKKFKVPCEDELVHVAGDGTITRSKSEALIIDLLNRKNIPYVYDFPMYLCGILKWPDFIILDKRNNREIVIEHLGKMSDTGYRNKQAEKLGLYIDSGYVPNENLLLTFDSRDGNINVPAISRMIDAIMCRKD